MEVTAFSKLLLKDPLLFLLTDVSWIAQILSRMPFPAVSISVQTSRALKRLRFTFFCPNFFHDFFFSIQTVDRSSEVRLGISMK